MRLISTEHSPETLEIENLIRADEELRKKQKKNRMAREAQNALSLPSDTDVILILVALIRHPNTSID